MTPVCDHCDGPIRSSNRGWPGFCSPFCRDTANNRRAKTRAERLAARRSRLSRADARRRGLTDLAL